MVLFRSLAINGEICNHNGLRAEVSFDTDQCFVCMLAQYVAARQRRSSGGSELWYSWMSCGRA